MPAALNGFKECPKCHQIKKVSDFFKDKNNKDGLQIYCKKCFAEINAKYRKNNKEKFAEYYVEYYKNNKEKIAEYRKNNREKLRQSKDWQKFRLTPEQSDIVENLRINGKCFICGRNAEEGGVSKNENQKKLCLDHNHDTLINRGILCNDCNHFEGFLKKQLKLRIFNINEIPKIWKDYLENPPGIPELELT